MHQAHNAALVGSQLSQCSAAHHVQALLQIGNNGARSRQDLCLLLAVPHGCVTLSRHLQYDGVMSGLAWRSILGHISAHHQVILSHPETLRFRFRALARYENRSSWDTLRQII